MKVGDLLRLNAEMMKLMSSFGVRMKDYAYVSIYDDYTKMVADGDKVEYIYAVLCERYNISKRTLQRVISRMKARL